MDRYKNLTALFVEDEKETRELLKDAISDEFKNFITAKDGAEGLEKFKKYYPDIIITDISMPKMSGFEMIQQIKKIKSVPIIAFSAFSETDKLLKAIDLKVDKYLIKPVDIEELLKVINLLKEDYKLDNIINLIDNFKYDRETKSLYKENKKIILTNKESIFFELLVKNFDSYLSYDELSSNYYFQYSSNESIRTLLKRIRQKSSKNLIQNLSKKGYALNYNISKE